MGKNIIKLTGEDIENIVRTVIEEQKRGDLGRGNKKKERKIKLTVTHRIGMVVIQVHLILM